MTEQGTIYIQGWSNGVQELSDFSDIYVSCKYGWKDTSLGTVTQTGTITNKSLTVGDSFDFITFKGDSHTITATWDDEQYIGVVPVIYDVILTYSGSSPKLNKLSFDPTNNGWTVIGDCETVDQGINSGYAIEFSNPQKEIHVETQTDKKAWSTTEPYFGAGVIADGAYYDETENTYIVIDGTNHPGELSFSSTNSWEPANTRNYSKQTSGSMFYMWGYNSITQCSGHNRYTWDPSDVYLCYDNTTTLTVDGITYTKQNPGPSEPDLTGKYFYNENRPNDGVIYFNSSSVFAMGTCNHTVDYGYTMTYDSSTGLWNIVFQRGPDSVTMYYDQNYNTIELYGYTYTYSSTDPCGTPSQPDLTGRYYFDSQYNNVVYFSTNQSLEFGACGEELSPRNYEWEYTDHWRIKMGANYMDYDENANTIEFGGVVFTYSSTDPCGGPGPQPIEKHIYLCDNSGAHLAEMTKTGSTWNVTGSFTSGMYSIRATVTNEYEDAWFKFYQTQGDNRIFVGAGDDPDFEEIGTYILVDNILTSFSLTEDQETGYYVVNYQNTEAMTASMVENIVNSYIGDFVTGSEISAMGYMTQTDISSMGYMTATDISAMSYVDSTTLNSMSYVDQTSLSSMSYVDITSLNSMSYVNNSYLSTYMNNVVGDINAILQTI